MTASHLSLTDIRDQRATRLSETVGDRFLLTREQMVADDGYDDLGLLQACLPNMLMCDVLERFDELAGLFQCRFGLDDSEPAYRDLTAAIERLAADAIRADEKAAGR